MVRPALIKRRELMDSVKIKRIVLLNSITKNRSTHRKQFLKAQKGYRESMIEWFEQCLKDARDGNKIRRSISLPEPEDHTSDYDLAIKMLEMSTESEIKISAHDFSQYVMDDWGWKANWTASNSMYLEK
jgi:hypothetical protein